MSLRGRIQDAFPQGWWRSWSWWRDGLREARLQVLVCFFAVVLAGRVRRMHRSRHDPRSLVTGRAETIGGGFISGLLQGGLLVHHVGGWGELHAGTGAFLVLCALNAIVGLWAISLVVGSRMREPVWWRLRDLADGRMPQDRPPETIEEYEAAQLDLELMGDGPDPRPESGDRGR